MKSTVPWISQSSKYIAVGCEDGSIYLKYDRCNEWQQMESIPSAGPILDICFNGGLIYASPMAGGIWYSELPAMPDAVGESDEATLTVTPNPATAFITVSVSEPEAALTLYDLQGKACYHCKMQGNRKEISLCGFPAGIYFVKIVGDHATMVRKFQCL